MGFALLTIFMFALAIPYDHWITKENNIGISAAVGKARAIVGAFDFLYVVQSQDRTKSDTRYPPGIRVKYSLIMLSVINFVGALFTLLVPESKGRSLEEISGDTCEDDEKEAVETQHVHTDSSSRTLLLPVVETKYLQTLSIYT
ncbi:hypothetical protein Syun_019140 [Stephania yunnanensis]|uniref:Uncharacterized protein n=1 Tax=Stephania yunnanensis TaxID=152371 RepID=A0AAP0NWE4_9MAGN